MKVRTGWPPRDSVFIPMCNKRYISKPQNKEIGSVSGKTDSPMLLLSCSRFSGWIPIWSMDAIPRNPSYSASFSPLIFLLHYPFLISLFLWLNMYFSKDTDSVPTFESPWIHRGWTPATKQHLMVSVSLLSWPEKAMAPTPALLPGKSHGWRSLVGCSPWGR